MLTRRNVSTSVVGVFARNCSGVNCPLAVPPNRPANTRMSGKKLTSCPISTWPAGDRSGLIHGNLQTHPAAGTDTGLTTRELLTAPPYQGEFRVGYSHPGAMG